MSDTLPFAITESAIAKLVELIRSESDEVHFLRVKLDARGSWSFSFEESENLNDTVVNYQALRVLLDPYAIKNIGDEATIDYRDDCFLISTPNAPNTRSTHEEEDGGCSHLRDLPATPSTDDLLVLRKGMRKQKPPSIHRGWHGGHDKLGQFTILDNDAELIIEWTVTGQPTKRHSFMALCKEAVLEPDRLEFGWLVANMAHLDKWHEMEAISIPHPLRELEARGRAWDLYDKIEKRWRHWAVVRAGHMIL